MKHTKFSNIGNDIVSLLFPRVCFGCNARLYRGEHVLCTFCRNQVPLTEQNFEEENAVDRIFYGRCRILKAASFLYFSHTGIVRNLIHYLKYRDQQVVGEFLGDWFGMELAANDTLKNIDFVIPVPLHPRKLRKRGYNQVTVFAQKLAHYLQAEFRDDLLVKTANSRTQTVKNRFFRTDQQKNLYQVENAQSLEGASVLLVDDIITTGATMEACTHALNSVPGIEVRLCSMAFVP